MNPPAGLWHNSTIADSGWIDGTSYSSPASVIVTGILAGDKIQIWVSNDPSTIPAAVEDQGVQYVPDIAQDGISVINTPFRWIKIKRTAVAGSGRVNAMMFSNRPAAT